MEEVNIFHYFSKREMHCPKKYTEKMLSPPKEEKLLNLLKLELTFS